MTREKPARVFAACALLAVAALGIGTAAPAAAQRAATTAGAPRFGFTDFPYDLTTEALERVRQLLEQHADVHAVHLDDGVPWAEVLAGSPTPASIAKDWSDTRSRIAPGRPVYLGLAPLAKDRVSLAPAKGGAPMPRALGRADLDDPEVMRAYAEYALRAARFFQPQYLNLGIEAGELAARAPRRWAAFETLYRHVRAAVKAEFPNVMVGISFGLQSLRKPAVEERARRLMSDADYLGLSFYPHMSGFGEKFGDPPLPAGAAAWTDPLDFAVRVAGGKPIGIAETGYSTRPVRIRKHGLDLSGDEASQLAYLRDLIAAAHRHRFAFVVWFLVADYDRLYEKLPPDEVNLLWRNIGLLDGQLRPKPAWNAWQERHQGAAAAPSSAAMPGAAPSRASGSTPGGTPSNSAPPDASGGGSTAPSAGDGAARLGFEQSSQVFACMPGSRARWVAPDTMQWSYDYAGLDWAWCVREMAPGLAAGRSALRLELRAEQDATLFVQLEEEGGEAFFAEVPARQGWSSHRIVFEKLRADPAKRRDGRLDAGRVVKLTIADAGARAGRKGRQVLELRRWVLE